MDRVVVKERENNPKENKEVLLASLRDIFSSLSLRSDSQIEKKVGKEKLEEISEDLAGIIFVATKGQPLMKNERLALTSKMLRCLSNYIEKSMQLPVTINTICTHISLIEHAVDLAFPGYIRCGLLRYAILPPRSNVA